MDLNNIEFSWLNGSPKHWDRCRVKHKFRIVKEKTDSIEGYPILSLTMKGIVERDISTNAGQLPDTYNGYALLQLDDIVFNPMDLISGWVDKSKFIGLISPSYKVIRPILKDVQIDYFKYFFQRLYKEKVFFPFGEGVHYEYRWGLGTETLLNFPLLSPPLKEQEQIVYFLDRKTELIDSRIEKAQQKIELLKEKRTALINQCVTKGLNSNKPMKDSGVEWIGEIPNHWEKSKFKFHSEIITGNTPSKKKEELYYTDDEEGLPWVKPTRLDQGFNFVFKSDQYLTNEGKNEIRLIPKNSIMVCSIGNSLGKFGISGCEMSTNQQINSVICDENTLFHRYCMFFVSALTEDLIKWTNFVTLPIFTKSDFEDTEIIIPPLSEQQQIIDYLDKKTSKIDSTISKEEKRIGLLKEYRQSLISNVVTGKIKVCN